MQTNARNRRHRERRPAGITPDPLWYKNAIIYEVHVRAFADSNGDGVGDLPGLTSKLDFLQDLGVTALWLLPFYPSPLRDGGYDIGDYTSVHPSYGTLDDFKVLLAEAHLRGIRIITELVINHTSADHAWFQRARHAPPGSPERDFYVWSDSPERYTKTRIIFKDFETSNWAWDSVAKAYYWHRFYSHQPDLNFDNEAVHQAVIDVCDFWLDMGVDGMRLDAVPYLYEREGTNCENLQETHVFLRKMRTHVDAKYRDRMLLAEANQWPIDAASYFGTGDECHMNFHFPLMPRMFMAVQMEDRFPIVDILRQTPEIPEACQWATFLRNHDELTLEMVTDEDRDYMYKVYTEDPAARINLGIRRRLAPLLQSRRRIELMMSLLFSLPGTPVLYYGDEIGMGDNVYLGDRDGVRTPMQWSADRNAGFSRANPQRLYLPVIIDPEYHYEAVNVELQQEQVSSLLWWTKRLISLRKEHPVFGFGDIEVLAADNPKVLAFVRRWKDDVVLVVANLSRHPQYAELDLSRWAGKTPVEMFGRTRFPNVTDLPYTLTFAPQAFYWFHFEVTDRMSGRQLPLLRAQESWTTVLDGRRALTAALVAFVSERRWFRGKARTSHATRIVDVLEAPVDPGSPRTVLFVLLEIEYVDGEPETYIVPLGFSAAEPAVTLQHRAPHALIAHLEVEGHAPVRGVLYDALATGEAARVLFTIARERSVLTGENGRFTGSSVIAMHEAIGQEDVVARVVELEQTNSTVQLGDRALLKVFRQVEPGINAEVEVGAFLDGQAPAVHVPMVYGSIAYQPEGGEAGAIAVVSQFVPNQGSAWDLFVREMEAIFETALEHVGEPAPEAVVDPFATIGVDPPPAIVRLAGQHLRHARDLGDRTARVHLALATGHSPAFAPEPFTMMHQQSLFQRAREMLVRTLEALSKRARFLPEDTEADVRSILGEQKRVEAALAKVMAQPIEATRIRSHGDLHLGQVLFTGDDFVIIDFEGEPARPLRERRYKRNPLRDVAGMLRSFSYVSEACLRGGRQRQQDEKALRPWAAAWTSWIGGAYLDGYVGRAEGTILLPSSPDARRLLLEFYCMEKCIYEIGYELGSRPAWLPIPIRGLVELLERSRPRSAVIASPT